MLSSFFYFLTYLGDISIVSDVYVDRYGGAGNYVRNTSTVSGGTMSKTNNGVSISAEAGATEITFVLAGSKGNFEMTKITVKMA